MSNILKITFVIIGTIIGAGFSSGQEIYTFFNRYGVYGLIGLVFSIILIGIVIYKTIKINAEDGIDTYQMFIERIIPKKLKKHKVLVFTINNIINIFLLISFNIMVARIFCILFSGIFYSPNNRKLYNCYNFCYYIFKRTKRNSKNKFYTNTNNIFINSFFRD